MIYNQAFKLSSQAAQFTLPSQANPSSPLPVGKPSQAEALGLAGLLPSMTGEEYLGVREWTHV
jgi:hypothetical protein